MTAFKNFFIRNEKLVPLFLFLLFLAVSIPGVDWGVPEVWNPDELVGRVDLALGGEIQFDETEPDYNYPSLPKYVMYGLGKVVYGLGYSRSEFIISARLLSALLGALAVVLVYFMTRTVGGDIASAALAGLLMIASGVVPANARFGHNDFYLQLFALLAIFALVIYQSTKHRLWLYGSFFAVGLAASSKFTGGSLILVPLFVMLVINWQDLRKDWIRFAEMLFIGFVLSFLGYASGTPKSLLWMSFYFKRVIPALTRYPVYGLQPDSEIGLLGQWSNFEGAVGSFIYYIFILSFLWFAGRLILARLGKTQIEEKKKQAIPILLLTLVFFDLPFMISVNYIPRYFIPFVPFFSILAALFVGELVDLAGKFGLPSPRIWIGVVLFLGISLSMLRLVSTALLFINDARKPAGEYLKTLSKGTILEYTLYPPVIPWENFERARNYPIFFLKYPGQEVPNNKAYEYNQGEAGLIERDVDYLVIDSFTYGRLEDEYICNSIPVECDFFKKLLADKTNYRLLRKFKYSLPPFLPQVSISSVNPEIRIYERVD